VAGLEHATNNDDAANRIGDTHQWCVKELHVPMT